MVLDARRDGIQMGHKDRLFIDFLGSAYSELCECKQEPFNHSGMEFRSITKTLPAVTDHPPRASKLTVEELYIH